MKKSIMLTTVMYCILFIIIGVLLLFGLSSCSNRLPGTTWEQDTPIYKVVTITTSTFENSAFCDYKISTNTSLFYWQNNYTLHDSVGKYNVGDEIKLIGVK